MSNVIESTRKTLEARRDELQPLVDEHKQLNQMLALMNGSASTAAPKPKRRNGGGSRPDSKRAPRGTTKAAIFAYIKDHPGCSARQIHEQTKVSLGTVNATLSKQRANGSLVSADNAGTLGWSLA